MTRVPRASWRAAVTVLAHGALLSLGGCGPVGSDGPLRPGQAVPEYRAVDLRGDTVSLRDLRGRVVLLNLWATWCAPCRTETPFLEELSQRHREDGLEIVGVSMDTRDASSDVSSFVEEYGVTYTILLDPEGRGFNLFQVIGLPATFLVDREGKLRWMRFGPVGEHDGDFREALEEALQ
ncbi:MAG: TlpA family protein disulfide reductase [Gemmatimonadota bacterium]|nr:TlpA family protein disulfide reductase [Gemmatimonadota bacterium]